MIITGKGVLRNFVTGVEDKIPDEMWRRMNEGLESMYPSAVVREQHRISVVMRLHAYDVS
jgi:hypothetical protein